MAELLVVANPRRRRKHKARRRKMTALQRKYFGKRKHRRRRRAPVAAAPRRRRKRYHRARGRVRRFPGGARAARGYTVGTKRIRRRKLNPHRRHYRRHRNPMSIRGLTSSFMPTVKAGGVGAVGALALDGAWGFVTFNLPSVAGYLTNPYVALVAKYAMAIGVGTLGGKLMRGKGRELAVGGATVVTHDFLKTLLQQMAPTIFGTGGSFPLGGLGSYLSGAAPIVGTATFPKTYMPFNGFGSYLSGPSGAVDDSPGVYAADAYGFDPWAGGTLDAASPWY